MEELNIISKKSKKNFTSEIFLATVVLFTIVIHFYNSSIINDVEKINKDINEYELSIKEVEINNKLQIASLLEINNKVIKSYKSMNQINTYINHMNSIQDIYDLKFQGFSLNNGELSSSVTIVSDEKGIAYQKTRDFLKNYKKDSKALFELGFVNQIQGMDEMKFKANFKIKN